MPPPRTMPFGPGPNPGSGSGSGSGSGPIEPGQWVRHPGRPDWGAGQVQSAIGARVTVNFQYAGKLLVNTDIVGLHLLDGPPPPDEPPQPP